MLFSRPRRNRYRRRPSRLTHLGKAVVAGTATAFLAIGWASQASHGPAREGAEPASVPAAGLAPELSPESGSAPESGIQPVSAPPRWPGAPHFPASPAASDPDSAARRGSRLDAAPRADFDAGPERPVAAAAAAAIPGDRPAALPAALDPSGALPPADPFSASRLGTPPTSRTRFERARTLAGAAAPGAREAAMLAAAPSARSHAPARGPIRPRLSEWIDARELAIPGVVSGAAATGAAGDRFKVEYTLDEGLTQDVFDILRRGRVERGVAIVIDPKTGRLLAYAATDSNVLPVERAYPAASIIKVITAAALLERRADPAVWDCLYEGNKYRLSPSRLDRPRAGNHATLEEALATSNNQCFSQWAIHGLGEPRLRRMIDLFGWSSRPAIGHDAGRVEPAANRYDLGQLGSGLDGVRVTPLHVASLASVLADGRLVEPRWIDRVVDAENHVVALPGTSVPRRVVSPRTADHLRELMVATTKRGTARRAFRTRRGVPLLGSIDVAGKTGNLNGKNPSGRYEWFFGVAPAEDPKVGVVVLQVHGHLWWARSSELAANILRSVFCEGSACRAELATRFTGLPATTAQTPVLVSDLEQTSRVSASSSR